MKPFWALLVFLFSSSVFGFIDIESLRQNVDHGFSGSSGAAIGGASGNVDVFDLGVNSQNLYKDNKREYILLLNYEYGEAKSLKNQNQGSFHFRYSQQFSDRWSWESFTQAEFNEFKALTLRKLLGAGLRVGLYKAEKNFLYLGLGSFYEDEKIKNDIDQANMRGNIYLSFRSLLTDNMESVLVAYYQPSYNYINDYRIQVTAGVETKVTKVLSLVNQFEFATDSKPPAGIQESDISYKVVFNFSY